MPAGRTGSTRPAQLTECLQRRGRAACAGSRRERRPGCTGAASIFPCWTRQRGDETHPAFFLPDQRRAEKSGGLLHRSYRRGDAPRHPWRTCARSPLYGGKDRGRRSALLPVHWRTRWCALRKSRGTRFLWSRAGWTRRRCTCRACAPACPRLCRTLCTAPFAGFEHLEIMRPAYAIEYDCADPTALATHAGVQG